MNKRFIANTSWIIGGQIIKNLLGFVVSIMTANMLGPSNFGVLGYITSITNLFTAIANLGLGNIIIKEIIKNKGKEGTVVGTAMTMQTISSSISYGLVVLTIFVLNKTDKIMMICALLQSLTLVFSTFDNISYYFQSRLESKFPTIISMAAYFVMQGYKIILLVTKKSVEWFAFAATLDIAIVGIVLVICYKARKGPKLGFSLDIAKALLKQSGPFIIAGSVSVIYTSLDRIMLKELLGATDPVAYYNVAYTISHVWVFVVSAFISSFSPLIYEALHEEGADGDVYKVRTRQMYCLTFWLGAMASIAIMIITPFLIKYAYKEVYRVAIVPTMILTWASVFAYLGVARGVQFVCENKQKYISLLALLTVVVNASLNVILIPRLSVVGAAIATLVSEFFVCIIAPLLLKPTRNIAINILQGIVFKGVNIKPLINSIKNRFFKKSASAVAVEQNAVQNDCKQTDKSETNNIDNGTIDNSIEQNSNASVVQAEVSEIITTDNMTDDKQELT